MTLKEFWQKAVATWNKVLAVWDVLVTIYYKVTFRDRWYIKYCWVEGDVKKRFKTKEEALKYFNRIEEAFKKPDDGHVWGFGERTLTRVKVKTNFGKYTKAYRFNSYSLPYYYEWGGDVCNYGPKLPSFSEMFWFTVVAACIVCPIMSKCKMDGHLGRFERERQQRMYLDYVRYNPIILPPMVSTTEPRQGVVYDIYGQDSVDNITETPPPIPAAGDYKAHRKMFLFNFRVINESKRYYRRREKMTARVDGDVLYISSLCFKMSENVDMALAEYENAFDSCKFEEVHFCIFDKDKTAVRSVTPENHWGLGDNRYTR